MPSRWILVDIHDMPLEEGARLNDILAFSGNVFYRPHSLLLTSASMAVCEAV